MGMTAADIARTARRLVVKVGSALLADSRDGAPNRAWLDSLASDIARLREEGREVVIVSSGAVALGRGRLGLEAGAKLRLEDKQAAAAAGQSRLMHAWEEALEARGLVAAQMLLTAEDTENRTRWLNARATLQALLVRGAVPVVNENDTVATDEIRYGDNDRLAARVAGLARADLLVLLSDVDGLYTSDPRRDATAAHVPLVRELSAEVYAMAAGPNAAAGVGSGGMATKLQAAAIARSAGCATILGLGARPAPLQAIEQGERATLVLAPESPLAAYKQWIAGAVAPRGALAIDAGACTALADERSLLPSGVTSATGKFAKGDCVRVFGPGGAQVATGLVNFSRDEVEMIRGRRSSELEALLGYAGRPEVIHRDDLVLVDVAKDPETPRKAAP